MGQVDGASEWIGWAALDGTIVPLLRWSQCRDRRRSGDDYYALGVFKAELSEPLSL